MKIALFIESFDHIRKNEFYVNSFCKAIASSFKVDFFELENIRSKAFDSYDLVISIVRLKVFAANSDLFSKILKGKQVHIFDHDPWEQFKDNSPYNGCYQKIVESNINAVFNVSSRYWANRVIEDLKFQCIPHVWGPILSDERKYRALQSWDARKNFMGFSGADYPWRVKNHNTLKSMFPEFVWQPKVPYEEFEDYMFNLKIWLQSEKGSCIEKGKEIVPNSLWPKSLEILSYGVFMIKDYQEESNFYEIKKLPTAFLFKEYEEIYDILEKILSMDKKEKLDRVAATIESISSGNYMKKAIDKIVAYSYVCL